MNNANWEEIRFVQFVATLFPMHRFVRNLITEWRRLGLAFDGGTVVVAVSGGADSVSLLLAMADTVKRKKIGHRIVAAHFDHGLRGEESDTDEVFVRELATSLNVEYVCGRGKVSKKGNLEQNARNARYEFLQKTAIENDAFAVLTGHTINDQAETFLLNLIRGSGIDGLSAIPIIRRLEDGTTKQHETTRNKIDEMSKYEISDLRSQIELIRPLLRWAKRADTEDFCRISGIEYRNDAMNDDVAFKRVRIRRELIPMLQIMNPKIVETLAGTAELLGQSIVNTAIQIEISDELKISELKTLSEGDLYQTLRTWLGHHRGNTRGLGLKHIKAIERLVFSEKSGRVAELPGSESVLREGGKLVYQKN